LFKKATLTINAVSVLLILFILSSRAQSAELKCTYVASMGKPFLARLVSPYDISDVKISWLDCQTPLQVTRGDGKYEASILLGSDVRDTKPGIYTLTVSYFERGRQWTLHHDIDVQPKSYPVQELKLPQAMVTPPKEVMARIKEESLLISNAINTITNERHWELPLKRPVDGIVTSPYGLKRIYNGSPGSPHRGVDFRAASGTPVRCAADGTVILTGDHYFGGKNVYVDHGNGVISCYMHLSKINVLNNQRLKKGDIIGYSGQTGRATGPHLHFGLYLLAHAVDPMPLFQ